MKRLLWLPVAGFLLVAGAAVAAAVPGLAAPSDGSGSRGAVGFEVGARGWILDEALAGLVTAGTITQEQSDAIVTALMTAAADRRAEFKAERTQLQEMRTQIRGFLEDGVISADEIAQLPADNPFTNLSDILADGQITQEELESVGPFGGRFFDHPGRGPGHHLPRGGEWFLPPGSETEASPSPDETS